MCSCAQLIWFHGLVAFTHVLSEHAVTGEGSVIWCMSEKSHTLPMQAGPSLLLASLTDWQGVPSSNWTWFAGGVSAPPAKQWKPIKSTSRKIHVYMYLYLYTHMLMDVDTAREQSLHKLRGSHTHRHDCQHNHPWLVDGYHANSAHHIPVCPSVSSLLVGGSWCVLSTRLLSWSVMTCIIPG